VPLCSGYRRLFWIWFALALVFIAGTVVLFAVMVWQPHLD
jgi:uncharacterized membrane protein